MAVTNKGAEMSSLQKLMLLMTAAKMDGYALGLEQVVLALYNFAQSLRLLSMSQDGGSDLSKSYDLVLVDDKLVVYSNAKSGSHEGLDLIATIVVRYSNFPDDSESGIAEIVSEESDAFGFKQVLFSSGFTRKPKPDAVIPSRSHVKALVKDLYDNLWLGLVLYEMLT